jgi:hypothetical protein
MELRSLTIDECYLSGALPDSMAKLSSIHSIEIWRSFAALSSIPSVLREMKSLRYLEFWDNDMTGGIPEWVCELTWLKTLWYSSYSLLF